MKKSGIILLSILSGLALTGCRDNSSPSKSDTPNKPSVNSAQSVNSTQSVTPQVTLTGIKASVNKDHIEINETTELEVNALFSDGSSTPLAEKDLTIETDATFLSREGMTLKALKEGETKTKVTYQGKTDEITLNISHIKVKSVTLVEPVSDVLGIGDTMQLEYTLFPENAVAEGLSFSSSAPEVISVSEAGLLTAIKEGESTVTVSVKDESKEDAVLSSSLKFTVKSVPVTGIECADSLDLELGTPSRLSYTILPENATDKKVTFLSSDETIVSVDENGTMQALKEGSAKVTLKTSNEEIFKEVSVNVKTNYDLYFDTVKTRIEAGKDIEYRSVIGYDVLALTPTNYRTKKKEIKSKVYANGTDNAHILTETKLYKDGNDPFESTKSYKGIATIDNVDKFYEFKYDLLKNTMDNASASFINSNLDKNQKQSRLLYDSDFGFTSYGISEIALNFVTSSSFMGASSLSSLKKWSISDDKIVLTAKGKNPKTTSSIAYYDASLTMDFASTKAITKLSYSIKTYGKTALDANGALKPDAVTEDETSITIDATYGNRGADSDKEFTPEGLFFEAPTFIPEDGTLDENNVYHIPLERYSKKITIKDTVHPYATNKVDKVEIESVSDSTVLKDDSGYSSLEIKALKVGECTVTFKTSRGKTFNQKFIVDAPKPKSIDAYYKASGSSFSSYKESSSLSVAINTPVLISAKVFPSDASQAFTLTCADADVTITASEETYSGNTAYQVSCSKKGTYELVFKAGTIKRKRSINFYDPADLMSDDDIKTLLTSKPYSGDKYTMTFLSDGTFTMTGKDGNINGTYQVSASTIHFIVTSHDKNKLLEIKADQAMTIDDVKIGADWDKKTLKLALRSIYSEWSPCSLTLTQNA